MLMADQKCKEMEAYRSLRPRVRIRTYFFSFILFTVASPVANSRSRGIEIDSVLDATLLERGVTWSHDKGHGYRMGKKLGQMIQSPIMSLTQFLSD